MTYFASIGDSAQGLDVVSPHKWNAVLMHHAGHQVQGSVCKTQAFMRKFADIRATSTADGYNPLLEDFSNTSFYIGKAGQAHHNLFVLIKYACDSYLDSPVSLLYLCLPALSKLTMLPKLGLCNSARL